MEIKLPTLHKRQAEIYLGPGRFKTFRCGRRFGKTEMLKTIACDRALKGGNVFWGAPKYVYLREAFKQMTDTLGEAVTNSNQSEMVIRTITGGRIDFWSLENENAGKSRFYDDAIIDEAAICKDSAIDTWQQAIRPTLVDRRGRAWVASSPKGDNEDNFFFRLCTDPQYGFTDYHAPSWSNPLLPPDELEDIRKSQEPRVYKQEYGAEFISWGDAAFFAQEVLLVDGKPVANPTKCDYVFATVDSTMKGGEGCDGTAITFFARNETYGIPLMVIDWEITEVEGQMLSDWIPLQIKRLEELAKQCGARHGSAGLFIEDKATGTILLQQGRNRGWPTVAINSKLTAMGKDERALNCSPYVYQGKVKLTEYAFDKVMPFRRNTKNHLLSQILSYVVNDPDAGRRPDDAVDSWMYGIAIALGNNGGF